MKLRLLVTLIRHKDDAPESDWTRRGERS